MEETSQTDLEAQKAAVHRVEILISNILRVGVIASLSIVVIGTVVTFIHHRDYLTSNDELERLTSKSATFPYTLDGVGGGLWHLEGRSIVIAGLLLLIATPVIRVAVSIYAFAQRRDRVFVVITTIVLALLLISFLLGKAGG